MGGPTAPAPLVARAMVVAVSFGLAIAVRLAWEPIFLHLTMPVGELWRQPTGALAVRALGLNLPSAVVVTTVLFAAARRWPGSRLSFGVAWLIAGTCVCCAIDVDIECVPLPREFGFNTCGM